MTELTAHNCICLSDYFKPLFFSTAVVQLRSGEAHKGAVKADRRIKEMEFTTEENRKNMERMTELVEKLQGKIRTWAAFIGAFFACLLFNNFFFRYKKQIEDAEEIAALNLAKFRKAQQQLEEAEERSKMAELNLARMRGDRVYFVTH